MKIKVDKSKFKFSKRTMMWTVSAVVLTVVIIGFTYFLCNTNNTSTPTTEKLAAEEKTEPSINREDMLKTKEVKEIKEDANSDEQKKDDTIKESKEKADNLENTDLNKLNANNQESEQKNTQNLAPSPDKEKAPSQNKTKITRNHYQSVAPSNAGYTQLYPDLYVTRPEYQSTPDKTIFLTFDDGPSARTAEILDILKQNDIKATFFVIGNRSQEAKALMKRIVDEGHTIAPHSYTHEFKQIYSSVEAFLSDFNKIYNLIYENTGVKPTIFRFAGGSKNSFNAGNYKEIIAEMLRRGFDYFDWNLSTGDAVTRQLTPAVKCISNVTKNSAHQDSAVVLMHDAAPKTTTVQALPGLIEELRNQGFKFDKLSGEIDPSKYSLIKPYA